MTLTYLDHSLTVGTTVIVKGDGCEVEVLDVVGVDREPNQNGRSVVKEKDALIALIMTTTTLLVELVNAAANKERTSYSAPQSSVDSSTFVCVSIGGQDIDDADGADRLLTMRDNDCGQVN